MIFPPPTARHATDRMEAQQRKALSDSYQRQAHAAEQMERSAAATGLSVEGVHELLSRPGVPEGHNAVVDTTVAGLQHGDYLLGSRQVVVRKFGLRGDSYYELSVKRSGRASRRVVWGARTTMRVTRRIV